MAVTFNKGNQEGQPNPIRNILFSEVNGILVTILNCSVSSAIVPSHFFRAP